MDIPSILSHYTASLEKNGEKRDPGLERFVIKGTDIQTRRFAFQNYNMHLLSSYKETSKYYTIPQAGCRNNIFNWERVGRKQLRLLSCT